MYFNAWIWANWTGCMFYKKRLSCTVLWFSGLQRVTMKTGQNLLEVVSNPSFRMSMELNYFSEQWVKEISSCRLHFRPGSTQELRRANETDCKHSILWVKTDLDMWVKTRQNYLSIENVGKSSLDEYLISSTSPTINDLPIPSILWFLKAHIWMYIRIFWPVVLNCNSRIICKALKSILDRIYLH